MQIYRSIKSSEPPLPKFLFFAATIFSNHRWWRSRTNTIAVRISAGSFGKQIIDPESYRHRYEARPVQGAVPIWWMFTIPLIPIPIRELAFVEQTQPEEIFYQGNRLQSQINARR